MALLRVFVADDYPEFVQKLVSLLEGRFEIVGTAADNKSAIDQIRRTNPDVAVLDIDMPPGNCIEMIRELTKHQNNLRIVTCAYEENRALANAAMQAGAIGFVSKERLEEDLVLAVDAAYRGLSFVSGESGSDGVKHARFFKELGHRVRELRLKAGYTQASMVRKLHCVEPPQSCVLAYEKIRLPSARYARGSSRNGLSRPTIECGGC